MFDTSLVRSRTIDAPRRVGLFTVSVAIHTAVALGAVAMSIATVEFPAQSPDQLQIYRPVAAVSMPPALGDGEPPRPVRREQPARPAEPAQVTAPVEVPNDTPVLETPGTGTDVVEELGTGEPGTGEGTGGNPLGEPGGIGDGPPGGIGLPAGSGPRVPGGEVRAARVLRRVEPRYPSAFVAARKSAVVTVRCVIDRNGRIRDPEVIASSWAPFNQAVLEAVQQWTFAPGTMRGEPVDTWFELTVRFEVR
jgi:protein TonB